MFVITHIIVGRSICAKNDDEMEMNLEESVVTEHVGRVMQAVGESSLFTRHKWD